jgi:5,10-methylenetetrahydromethanopterin reductase
MGIDSFWFYEIFRGYEAFARAGYLAGITSNAKIGVGVVNPYSRHPAVTAMGAMFLSNFSGGRGTLVVGVGSGDWVGGLLGYDQSKPGQRLSEYVSILRRLLEGEEVTYRSDSFALNKVKLFPGPEHPVPIIIACEQPKMIRLAGKIGDGLYLEPTCCPIGYIKWAKRMVEESGAKGRDFRLIANLPLSVTDNPEKARAEMKPTMAFHLSFPQEAKLYLEKSGFPASLGEEIGRVSGVPKLIQEGKNPAEAFDNGGLQKAAALVPDEFVDQSSVIGDLATCRSRLLELEKAGLTDVVFSFQDGNERNFSVLPRA